MLFGSGGHQAISSDKRTHSHTTMLFGSGHTSYKTHTLPTTHTHTHGTNLLALFKFQNSDQVVLNVASQNTHLAVSIRVVKWCSKVCQSDVRTTCLRYFPSTQREARMSAGGGVMDAMTRIHSQKSKEPLGQEQKDHSAQEEQPSQKSRRTN